MARKSHIYPDDNEENQQSCFAISAASVMVWLCCFLQRAYSKDYSLALEGKHLFLAGWLLNRPIWILEIHAAFIHCKMSVLFSLKKWIQLILNKNGSMLVIYTSCSKRSKSRKKSTFIELEIGYQFCVCPSQSAVIPTYSPHTPISITRSTWINI